MIWKTKANDLFALTPRDMADVVCKVIDCGSGWRRRKEVHLMRRDTVLQLALDKHGGTYRAINDAFLKRAEARRLRNKRKRPPRVKKARYCYNDWDCSDYSCDDDEEEDF